MAKEFRFFKIGEANAEIARLEAELSALKSGQSDNDSEIAKQAEAIKADRDSIKAQLDAEKALNIKAVETIASKDSEIAALKQAQADFDKKVEAMASAKAQQISASQGVPPVTSTPATNPADSKPKSEKRGIARVQELIASEIGNTKRN